MKTLRSYVTENRLLRVSGGAETFPSFYARINQPTELLLPRKELLLRKRYGIQPSGTDVRRTKLGYTSDKDDNNNDDDNKTTTPKRRGRR